MITDLDREGRLAEIADFMKEVTAEALTYFSRANDITFFPDDDDACEWAKLDVTEAENWKQISYRMHVHAYSNIGEGACFHVDFRDNTFIPFAGYDDAVVEIGSRLIKSLENDAFEPFTLPHTTDENAEAVVEVGNSLIKMLKNHVARIDGNRTKEAVVGIGKSLIEMVTASIHFVVESDNSSGDEDEDWESDTSTTSSSSFNEEHERSYWEVLNEDSSSDEEEDKLEYDTGSDEEGIHFERVLCETSSKKHYDIENMVTRVKVSHDMPFGELLPTKSSGKKSKVNDCDGGEDVYKGRKVLDRAIEIAWGLIGSNATGIRPSKEDMEEYKIADAWVPSESLTRPPGWARRPTRDEGMYGKSYMTEEYLDIVEDLFKGGSAVSSNKKGPPQMKENIQEKKPGRYCYPFEHEISKAISRMFQREKDGKQAGRETKKSKIPEHIELKIKDLVRQFPEETGNPIAERLRLSYGRHIPEDFNRKDVMTRVGALRSAAKTKKRNEMKRGMIG